jgi:hypothetical protein
MYVCLRPFTWQYKSSLLSLNVTPLYISYFSNHMHHGGLKTLVIGSKANKIKNFPDAGIILGPSQTILFSAKKCCKHIPK